METNLFTLLGNGGILDLNRGDTVNTPDGEGPLLDIFRFASGLKAKVDTGATISGPAWYDLDDVTIKQG